MRHRAQVGVQAQRLADAQQPLLGPDLGAWGRPTWARPPRPAARRRTSWQIVDRLGRQRACRWRRWRSRPAGPRAAANSCPNRRAHRLAAPATPRPSPRARCRRPAEPQSCKFHGRPNARASRRPSVKRKAAGHGSARSPSVARRSQDSASRRAKAAPPPQPIAGGSEPCQGSERHVRGGSPPRHRGSSAVRPELTVCSGCRAPPKDVRLRRVTVRR